jgi:pimeloyl-ACP methyl ester carboxylesterase
VDRPRLLLLPSFTELEWEGIRPHLEEWADVASFDLPGVGEEPRAEKLERGIVAQRGVEELDRRGWDSCFVASDGWGVPSAALLGSERPESILGMALGHARLSQRREGDRAPINGAVWSAMTELIGKDHEAFIYYGIAQATGGSVSEELAERMVARFPRDLLAPGWEAVTSDDVPIGELLARLDCPLLFAKHEGCLMSTEEGFDDAVAAFPQARTISVTDAPLSSEKFAESLREFCQEFG